MIPAAELRAGTAFRYGGELLLATGAGYRVAAGEFGGFVFVKSAEDEPTEGTSLSPRRQDRGRGA